MTVTARNEKGQTTWVLSAESSSVVLAQGQEIDAEVQGVTGELYRDGKLASRYEARTGVANDARRTLKLKGTVRVTSEERKIVLSAAEIEWVDDRQLIAARGSVWIRSDAYEMGPLPELWATPDLSRIGSPDRFKK